MKETEIKLRSSGQSLLSLLALDGLHPDYVLERDAAFNIQDLYFDTEHHLLLRQGASLRHRLKGGVLNVTLKSHPLAQGATLTRTEIEREISEAESRALLEQGVPPACCAELLVDLGAPDALKPVLQVLNARTVRRVVHPSRGMVAELALDRVLFLLNGQETVYEGVEVEVIGNGTQADLDAISKGLMERAPDLAPDPESKYEKGMRLLSEREFLT